MAAEGKYLRAWGCCWKGTIVQWTLGRLQSPPAMSFEAPFFEMPERCVDAAACRDYRTLPQVTVAVNHPGKACVRVTGVRDKGSG
eukprot:scaffold81800_cov14-Tisochrysis_lutea.AAC.1